MSHLGKADHLAAFGRRVYPLPFQALRASFPEGKHLLTVFPICPGYLLAISLICAWQRQMNLPGRSAATLPALGRVGTGSMLTVFLICAMNG